MPLFSVVIPTYNGAHLLQYALQSVLDQKFDDYEIIVSNNCSIDNTRQVIADLGGKRVRYLSPERHMNAADHWDFAVRHAKGRYIMMLGDDDCMTPNMLDTLSPLAQPGKANLISYAVGRYYHPDYFKPELRNQLQIKPFTRELLKISAIDALRRWYNVDAVFLPPPSALISRRVVDEVIARGGRFFFPPCPDYCAFAMVLAFGGDFMYLDRPLLAFGRSTKSTGEIVFGGSPWSLDKNAFEKRSSVKWCEASDGLYEFVPLRGNYWVNGFAESLLKARRALPEKFAEIEELAWVKYYIGYYHNMRSQEVNGLDVGDDILEFYEVVSRLPDELRKEVKEALNPSVPRSLISRQRQGLLRIASSAVKRSSFLKKLAEMALGREIQTQVRSRWPVILRGDEEGFSNILECAQKLEMICSTIEPDEEAWSSLARKVVRAIPIDKGQS